MDRLNIFSPSFDPCDSYGRLANELATGIEAQGGSVNRIGGDAPDRPIRPVFGGLLLGYPTLYGAYGALASTGPRVAVTMFESTILPPGWVENLNRCDAVVVPSSWCADVFRANGVRVPVHTVPLGVSDAFLQYRQRNPQRQPFTFLAIADRGQRKGWLDVGLAFDQAFGQDPAYRLIFKSRRLPIRISNPNIEVIAADYSDAELAALYTRAHVMVFPARGEGFGLPPREFAGTGGLALATNWSGLADDIEHWGVPINRFSLTPAWSERNDWHGQLGVWAAVDVAELAQQMRIVAEHYAVYAERLDNTAAFVRETYSWTRFANRVYDIWKEIADGRTQHDRTAALAAQAGS